MAAPRSYRGARRPEPAQPESLLGSWQVLAGVATGIVGLGAYVYLLGGIVVWLRAVAARLPADNVVAVTENRVLLAQGVRTLFFELALAGALAVAIPLVQVFAKWVEKGAEGRVVNRRGSFSELALAVVLRAVILGLVAGALLGWLGIWDSSRRWWVFAATMVGWCVLEIVLRTYTGLLAEPATPGGREPLFLRWSRRLEILLIVAILLFAWLKMAAPLGAAVTVLLILLFLVNRFPLFSGPRARRGRRRALAVVISALAVNIIIVTYTANPPVTLDRAEVTTSAGGSPVVGAYLGRDSDGVHLAVCTPLPKDPDRSKRSRIVTIPAEQVKLVEIGGYYSFDVGRRPTLYGLARHFITGESLGRESDGAELDLREERVVCGQR